MPIVLVRRFEARDLGAVRRVHAEAFLIAEAPDETPVEVTLLDALIDADDVFPELSIVAERDGQVVGHVMCSRATVGSHPAAGLGPIGVLPARQRRGVGAALMHAVLGAADALGLSLVGLLGSTEYYPRFGFVPATTLGIEPPDPGWGGHFQIRTLTSYRSSITGPFRYAPAFDSV